ncbi:hypothetical protein FSP39_002528 [Pinctada imbricata]|uniref:Carboxylesterase type B domain-containing protein n=1 Tax=Pinctada imbricata TaxID=66713 RepID=A0AA88XEV2_PINIB|nr:hypothetical protein FSP39_002528 [Pinctada imbricata]
MKGIKEEVEGLSSEFTYQFRGIPYAKPPVGELRFKKPQSLERWNYTLDATVFGPSCMQTIDETFPIFDNLLPNKNVSEDCLLLNVYVPASVEPGNISVMIWVHGGGYVIGQGMFFDPSYMSAKGKVIIVTINYRLGIFGFASLHNGDLKGNYGLWDQIMAMRWVKNNIMALGGDPDSITIYGESAGGFSVGLQALIPTNKGLFHRVIAQSGMANSLFAVSKVEPNNTLAIGKEVGCDIDSYDVLYDCMMNKSAAGINAAASTVSGTIPDSIQLSRFLAPVVDNELFSDLPENLIRNEKSDASIFFKSLDIIIGNVNAEGTLLFGALPQQVQTRLNFSLMEGIPYEVFCDDIVQSIARDYFSNNVNVKNAICKEYGHKNNDGMQGMEAINMYTDLFFISPAVSSLRQHTKSNTLTNRYQYLFTYDYRPIPVYPTWFHGAVHASEIFYLFSLRLLPSINITINSTDKYLSDQMVAYWTNFAKTG